jgi:hypothetical protein
MQDQYNKIVGDRNRIEELLAKIPGFGGYMEMSARREADRKLREHVAAQFPPLTDRLAAIERDILGLDGGLMHMEKTKSLKTQLHNLQQRIATDSPGYSGFFATNKIGPDELEQVYAFDESMLTGIESIAAALDGLATAVGAGGGGLKEALAAFESAIRAGHEAYDKRDQVLKGFSD